MIKSGNVTVFVNDMKKAIEFYTKVLGFKLKSQYGNEWAEIQAPDLTIGLHGGRKSATKGHVSIGFQVDNLDKSVKELEKKGISFKIHEDGPVKIAHFKDPEGTALYLCQVY